MKNSVISVVLQFSSFLVYASDICSTSCLAFLSVSLFRRRGRPLILPPGHVKGLHQGGAGCWPPVRRVPWIWARGGGAEQPKRDSTNDPTRDTDQRVGVPRSITQGDTGRFNPATARSDAYHEKDISWHPRSQDEVKAYVNLCGVVAEEEGRRADAAPADGCGAGRVDGKKPDKVESRERGVEDGPSRESAHLKLRNMHHSSSSTERGTITRTGASASDQSEEDARSSGDVDEGNQEVESSSVPSGTVFLMEYRPPGEDGECFASLGDDGSKFALFLDARVGSRNVPTSAAPATPDNEYGSEPVGVRREVDRNGAERRTPSQVAEEDEAAGALDAASRASGALLGELEEHPSTGEGSEEGWLAQAARTISIEAGKWAPYIFVSPVNLTGATVRDSLQVLWTKGQLLSQDLDAVDVLNGGERNFSELLKSYTIRTKSNHWEEIPRDRLLDVLKRHHPEVLARCGHDPHRPVAETLSSLRDMLEWFRKDFPYYYDACLSCGNRENNTFVGYVSPTEDERTFKAGRTELYHCSSCGALSRFARYTAVSKVLETQRGRCGEYSVLMLRLLESLGYRCRWIVDWSDHVWAEAFIGGRWVHVDPCEAAIDEPLLYESWGKNQTYIIAFTPHEIVDVTEHYTSNFEAAKARRDVDSDTMRTLIAEATRTLRNPP